MKPTSLVVMVGLPGAGKTTEAKRLAREHQALRFSPDDWMIPLFGESDANGMRDVLEGRLIWCAREALRVGTSVVLDFGLWTRNERHALSSLARSEHAAFELVYLPISEVEQDRRIASRRANTPNATFQMTSEDLARWRSLFEEPDPDELAGTDVGAVPDGYTSWAEWSAARWPTSAE